MDDSSAGPPPFYKRKSFKVGVGFAVTVVCLAAAFYTTTRGRDPREVLAEIGRAFRRADYRTLPLIWGTLLAFYVLKARRWVLLLRPLGRFTPGQSFRSILIGFAFNNVLPARIGEFVRVFVFARQQRLSNTAVLSSVALERIFDSVMIFGVFLVGLWRVPNLDETIRKNVAPLAALIGCGLVGACVYLVWTRPFIRIVEGILARLKFLPAGLRKKLCGILEAGAVGLASLKDPRLVVEITVNSLVQWLLNALQMYFALRAFDIHVSPWVACLLMGVVAVGVAAPQGPGYFGTMQLLWLLVINERTVGVKDKEAVFAASLYYQFSQYVPVTLLGLYYFNRTGLSVSEVRHEAEEQQAGAESVSLQSTAG